jgi:hypothetical protein
MRRLPLTCILAALALYGVPAHAQGSAENRAAADALYEEGGALLKAGRFAEACPKLETSQRLDPGIGTLLRLGFCYEHIGRTASAWSAYNDAEAMARRLNDNRANDAATRAKAVEPRLSKLLVTIAAPVPGLTVKRDGTVLDPGLLGTPAPVDSGEHAIEATAPGKLAWRGNARVGATPGVTTLTIPPLLPGPVEVSTLNSAFVWTPQRIASVAVGSAGALGLVTGGVLGGFAIAKNTASKAECVAGHPDVCSSAGVSDRTTAGKLADASTGALIGGGAALAAGVIVFLTAPPGLGSGAGKIEVLPVASPSIAGLSLRGGW